MGLVFSKSRRTLERIPFPQQALEVSASARRLQPEKRSGWIEVPEREQSTQLAPCRMPGRIQSNRPETPPPVGLRASHQKARGAATQEIRQLCRFAVIGPMLRLEQAPERTRLEAKIDLVSQVIDQAIDIGIGKARHAARRDLCRTRPHASDQRRAGGWGNRLQTQALCVGFHDHHRSIVHRTVHHHQVRIQQQKPKRRQIEMSLATEKRLASVHLDGPPTAQNFGDRFRATIPHGIRAMADQAHLVETGKGPRELRGQVGICPGRADHHGKRMVHPRSGGAGTPCRTR